MTKVANPYGATTTPQAYNPNATDSKGVSSAVGVFTGMVKKVDDLQNFGRIKVYIPEFGGDPEKDWTTVSYASPFGGATSIYEQGENVTEYADTIKSYGFWATPPNIDTWVLCAFPGGKTSGGYYFASIFQRGTQVSIPGLGRQKTHDGDDRPAAPKNKKDKDTDYKKYVTHKPLWEAVKRQGIEKDFTRGLSSSSVERESPSKVIGILTPGQQQFVMDDGDKDGNNRQIRLRTQNGTQLLLDDTSGHAYMITKDGNTWMELSNDGQIHIYGAKDINVHSEKNINLRAGLDINLEAGRNINMKSMGSGSSSMTWQSGGGLHLVAEKDVHIETKQSMHNKAGTAYYETAPVIHMNGPEAVAATPLTPGSLPVNDTIKESICTNVPEKEPWKGHAGKINTPPGTASSKADPAPDKEPRQPKEDENPETGDVKEDEEVDIDQAEVTDEMKGNIKTDSGFSPVAVDAMGNPTGPSIGFGSTAP